MPCLGGQVVVHAVGRRGGRRAGHGRSDDAAGRGAIPGVRSRSSNTKYRRSVVHLPGSGARRPRQPLRRPGRHRAASAGARAPVARGDVAVLEDHAEPALEMGHVLAPCPFEATAVRRLPAVALVPAVRVAPVRCSPCRPTETFSARTTAKLQAGNRGWCQCALGVLSKGERQVGSAFPGRGNATPSPPTTTAFLGGDGRRESTPPASALTCSTRAASPNTSAPVRSSLAATFPRHTGSACAW